MTTHDHDRNGGFDNPVCLSCGKPCEVIPVDFGIGPYEFWGQKCVHKDIQPASSCCWAEVIEMEDDTDE